MPAAQRKRWTLAEVERLIDERVELSPRYELVDGELLVTPAPSLRHQRIILELAFRLRPYLTQNRLGEVRLGPGELKLRADEHYEPDLFVMPLIDGRLAPANALTRPLLVCETMSPSSGRHDRVTKRRSFQTIGVPAYWIADGDAELFEIWHAAEDRPLIVADRLVWAPDGAPEPFELDVRGFFASVADGAELA